MDFSKQDYIKILDFYKVDYNKDNFIEKAEHILCNKMCKCILREKSSYFQNNETEIKNRCSRNIFRKTNANIVNIVCSKKGNTKCNIKLKKNRKNITLKQTKK